MFSVTSSSVPPPAPPNLKVLQDSWPSSLPQSSSTISPVKKEETPWLFDSASILQPKALLPTPTARYCQPPPMFRAGSATARPPAPLFPVPPPGSCLLPPPPLATDTGAVSSGVISPHNWQDSASGVPSNKPERMRKQSWAAENSNVMVLSSPTRSAYYNYQKPLHSRPRTLVEVPLQTKLQDTKQESTYQAPNQSNNIISILQSNLDPNCRPFTPANLASPSPIPFSESSGKSDGTRELSRKESVSTPSCHKIDMEELTLVSSEREEFLLGEDSSYLETISDKSLCFSNNSGRGNESSLLSMSNSKSLEASKLSEDPLPEDPKAFLPKLDTSHDELIEEKAVSPIPPTSTAKPKFSLMSSDCSVPPSVFPFAHWSGQTRPPLLPTPKNFPPYGPRQPKQASLFEDDLPSPGLISPKLRSIHGQGHTPISCSLPRVNEPSTINASLSATIKKPDVVGRITRQQTAAMDISSSTWKPTSTEKNNLKLATESNSKDVPLASPGFRHFDGADWTPEFGGLMPGSLIESYPVPDEYMVAKVIGPKLPSIKLRNCHTDLLFFLFYSFQEDELQLLAASLLFERGWRYHKQDQVWLARWPGVMPEKKTVEWEEGLYQYFDVKVWRRIPGWFRLNYEYLAEKTGVTDKDLSLKQIYTKTWLKT